MIAHPRLPQIRTCALTHPAPRPKHSLRGVDTSRTRWSRKALRWRPARQFRDLLLFRCDVLAIQCPRHLALQKVFRPVGRFPPAGPLGGVPRAPRFYQPTPTTPPPSRRTSLPSLGATWSVVPFAPVGRTAPTGLGSFFRGAPTASQTRNNGALPGSWATLAYMPCSSTPAEHAHPAHSVRLLWSSARLTTSTPQWLLSRLNHTACTPPVYASQAGSLPHHATLGSGGWPVLTGSGLTPDGSQ